MKRKHLFLLALGAFILWVVLTDASEPPEGELQQEAQINPKSKAIIDSDGMQLSLQPQLESATGESLEKRDLAVTILITTKLNNAGDVGKSLDGASVLRHSILDALFPYQSPVRKRREIRKIGLESFSSVTAVETDGERDRNVDIFQFKSTNVSDTGRKEFLIDMRFVALVTPCVPEEWHSVIERIGFEVWIVHSPLNADEVRNQQIRTEIVSDGAMGINEMTKLEGLRMTQFDTVLMVDCDVMFHKTFDELLFIQSSLAWTHGGWEAERINGGFLVFNPKNPFSLTHMNNIVEIVREGDFRAGSAWRGKGIGWTYGGRTIQGVLPYYFFLEAYAMTGHNQSHIEIERCRYNNMVQLEKCKQKPSNSITSNHFTGECMKPWWCATPKHPLCMFFSRRWFTLYRDLLMKQYEEEMKSSTSDGLRQFVVSEPTFQCPRGGYVSIADVLLSTKRRANN